MANKHLDLFKVIIPSVDAGIKDLWEAADEDGRKDIIGDLWNLNRYISSISNRDCKPGDQEVAVLRVNEYYNKNYNDIQKEHKKLLWFLLCIAGKRDKKGFHPWIKLERKKDTSNKAIKLVSEIYPNMKWDEVETLVRLSTKKELKELAAEHGYDKVDL